MIAALPTPVPKKIPRAFRHLRAAPSTYSPYIPIFTSLSIRTLASNSRCRNLPTAQPSKRRRFGELFIFSSSQSTCPAQAIPMPASERPLLLLKAFRDDAALPNSRRNLPTPLNDVVLNLTEPITLKSSLTSRHRVFVPPISIPTAHLFIWPRDEQVALAPT